MKSILSSLIACAAALLAMPTASANVIYANAANYTGYLGTLAAGDTLYLATGNYTNNLTLNGRNGTPDHPIVIMGSGNTTVFKGQSCCNTVSITKCSYLIIKNLQLDGANQDVDAVKGEGTAGNWTHHITLEYLNIINYGADQQDVGISTKCPAWNWIIRKNRIIGAGTGLYLGNSDGTKPFVNGLIEYNYVANTVGYNMEIKHQINGQRELLPETSVDGKTIIRHNVFTKDASSSTGANARPNLLVGGFPTVGWGAMDYYEIYGNLFYNNPVEALFQGTGNIMMYNNIFINHFDPSGFRAIYITPQNGVSPQDIKVFHNTVWALNSAGGIRLYNPNASYQQLCYGNAVFSPSPITNFTDAVQNITDSYANAGTYVLSASTNIAQLDLYPKSGQLTGALTTSLPFQNHTSWDKDFNGNAYNWTFRGAYSGCCTNNGWHLQLDTMSTPVTTTAVFNATNTSIIEVYPNPVTSLLHVDAGEGTPVEMHLFDLSGREIFATHTALSPLTIDLTGTPEGIYFLWIKQANRFILKQILKQ